MITRHRRLGRATLVATALIVLTFVGATLAQADTVAADTDTVMVGAQATLDLGTVAPGAVLVVPVGFELECKGLDHVDAGATVGVSLDSATVPLDGTVAATDGLIGPVQSWPADGTTCFTPPQIITRGTAAQVTVTAPTTGGGPYEYSLSFAKTVSNGNDAAVTGFTFASVTLSVVSNTPPVLHLPADQTLEATSSAGAVATYVASATDAQDDPAPTPDCSPASGSTFPLGTTTVACTVIDSGGLADSGTFDIDVVDTTPPVLIGVPSGLSVGTTDPSGTAVTWPAPSAGDVADPAPSVSCSPASGSTFRIGTTNVTCTTFDASANHASASFDVHVDLLAATFDAPIGPTNVLALNGNRSLPVKARLWRNGVLQTAGDVSVTVAACGASSTVAATSLTWTDASGGRWVGKLDLGGLPDACYRGTLLDHGQVAGWFDLQPDAASGSPAAVHRRR